MSGVFWLGADRNMWVKDSKGVRQQNLNLSDPDVASQYKMINDPNPPAQAPAPSHVLGAATAAPSGGGGGGGYVAPAHPPLNQGAVNNTQTTINQIPGLLQAALASEATSHTNTLGNFDAAQGVQQKTYDGSTVTNQQNYDANFMDSIRAGIKGLGSLVSVLRGGGAAGGTAETNVRDVVGSTTSNDIRNGADTHDANQGQLDSTLANFLSDLKGKRQAAEDTFTNNNRAIQRDSSTQLQDLYGKMAGYYGDAGDTAHANDFVARAGSLTPGIAANSKSQTSAYDTTPVVIHAPNLTAFAAPSQPDVASVPQDGQVGSGIFSMAKKKGDSAPVPVTAAQGA